MSKLTEAAEKYVLTEIDPSDYVNSAPDELAKRLFEAGARWMLEEAANLAHARSRRSIATEGAIVCAEELEAEIRALGGSDE